MNALLRPPALNRDNILDAIRAGDDTLLKLAEWFDIDASNFTLRRLVFELADRKEIRVVERLGEPDQMVPAKRRAKR